MKRSSWATWQGRIGWVLALGGIALAWGLAVPWLDSADRLDPVVLAGLGAILAGLVGAILLDRFDRFVWAYLILLPISRQFPYHDLVTDLMTVVMVGLYAVRKLISGQLTVLRPPRVLVITIAVYLGVVLMSALVSPYRRIGLVQLAREILFFVVTLVLFDWLRTEKQWMLATKSLVWVSVAISASIVLDRVLRGPGTNMRNAGFFVSPTRASLILTAVFAPTMGYLAGLVRRQAPYARWLRIAYILMTLLASALTGSRNALLMISLSLILLYWPTLRRHWKAVGIIGLVVLFLVAGTIWATDSADALAARLRLDRGLSGRGYLWQRAWAVFETHPILGTGPSTFRYYAVDAQILEPYGTIDEILAKASAGTLQSGAYWVPGLFGGVIGNNTHNIFLGALANTGLLGLLAELGVLAAIFLVGARALQAARSELQRTPSQVVYGCWVALLVAIVKLQFEEGIFKGALVTALTFWLVVLILARAPSILDSKSSLVDPQELDKA